MSKPKPKSEAELTSISQWKIIKCIVESARKILPYFRAPRIAPCVGKNWRTHD